MQRFRGGLVFKAHRRFASLNSRLGSNKEEDLRNLGGEPALADSTAGALPLLPVLGVGAQSVSTWGVDEDIQDSGFRSVGSYSVFLLLRVWVDSPNFCCLGFGLVLPI